MAPLRSVAACAALFTYASIICFTRVWEGEHTLPQIFAGAFLGSAYALIWLVSLQGTPFSFS
jgi:hypothetical protein